MEFGLEFEYKCAKLFYQDNQGKAFKLSYDQKLHFIALSKQIAKGPFDPEKPDSSGCEASYFNLVGNDRKTAWQKLGNMGRQDAMMEFVAKLRDNCSSFDPWYRAHVKIEQEKHKLENSSLLDCMGEGENEKSCNPLSPERSAVAAAAATAANVCAGNNVMNSVSFIANGGDLVKNGGGNGYDVNANSAAVLKVGGTRSTVNSNMKVTENDRNASSSSNNNNNNCAVSIQQAAIAVDKKKDAQSNKVGKSWESSNFIGPKNNTDALEIGDGATTGNSLQHLQQIEEQTTLIKNALNAQTFRQFKQYAVSRYPEDEKAQDKLINELQQQHFQQYMQHIYYQQMAQMKAMQNANNIAINLSVSSGADAQQISPNSKLSFEKEMTKSAEAPNNNDSNTPHHHRPESFVHFDDEVSNKTSNENKKSGGGAGETANFVGGAPNLNSPLANESLLVANPSMWANKNMKEFKELVKKDSNLVIRVGRGELVTIRVPTHEDGSFLFWEFATDSYDIGFGLHFEWTISPTNEITITAEEPEEDEDEEVLDSGNPNDVEKMTHFDRVGDKPALDVIVPIYRRDSHLEVQAGSHEYPGQGCYLLKFDNTFSLFRGKTLYYRVYYTK